MALTPELRERMTQAAVAIGEQLRYTNAGTVEFILDATGNFYFLEVNTRLQVEHAVTEMVTGLDLVHWQIRVAEGHPLPLSQADVRFAGHAVEARLYSEVPDAEFLPASGVVVLWREPASADGVRVDSGVMSGDTISPFYDPLLAKLVAHGEDRAQGLRRLDRALSKTVLFGIPSNRDFLRCLLLHPEHLAGRVDTGFIDRHRADLTSTASSMLQNGSMAERAASAAILAAIRRFTQAQGRGHWRNNPSRPILERFKLVRAFGNAMEDDAMPIDVQLVPVTATRFEAVCAVGEAAMPHVVELRGERDDDLDVELNGRRVSATVMATEVDWWWVALDGEIVTLARQSPFPEPRSGYFDSFGAAGRAARPSESAAPGVVVAPLPGQVSAVFVVVGQVVRADEPLLVIEAMKMEHVVRSSRDGEVAAIFVGQGDQARHGFPLLEITVHQAKEADV